MTSWTDFVTDAAAVKAIFGLSPPTLNGIDLHEIILHRDGPSVRLRFDVRDFPAHPPKKWLVSGFNRVQVKLLASGVQELQLAGLQLNIKIDLEIYRAGPLIRLHADNGTVRFDITTEFLIVEGISAYREGPAN